MQVFPNLAKRQQIQLNYIKGGELILFQNDTQFHSAIFNVAGKYILFHAFRVSCKNKFHLQGRFFYLNDASLFIGICLHACYYCTLSTSDGMVNFCSKIDL
jgi:hypothetical protein